MGLKDKTRIVHYKFEPEPGEAHFDQTNFDIDKILKKAFDDGVITEYDDGRGCWPWFGGRPGKEIRKLRDQFLNAKRDPAPLNDPYQYCPWKKPK